MKFHKAKLFQIKWLSKPTRYMYFRIANASEIWFWMLHIIWRRPMLPQAAYMQGWDAAFRQFNGMSSDNNQKEAANCMVRSAEHHVHPSEEGRNVNLGEWVPSNQNPPRNDYYFVCWTYDGTTATGEAWWDEKGWVYPAWSDDKDVNPANQPDVQYWIEMPTPPSIGA